MQYTAIIDPTFQSTVKVFNSSGNLICVFSPTDSCGKVLSISCCGDQILAKVEGHSGARLHDAATGRFIRWVD